MTYEAFILQNGFYTCVATVSDIDTLQIRPNTTGDALVEHCYLEWMGPFHKATHNNLNWVK